MTLWFDLYRYSKWLLLHPINPDESVWSSYQLQDVTQEEVLKRIQTCLSSNSAHAAINYFFAFPTQDILTKVVFDISNKSLLADGSDTIFLYAHIVDINGTVIPEFNEPVKFSLNGPAFLIGNNPIKAEAGIATILLKASDNSGEISVCAKSEYNNKSLVGEGKILNTYKGN